MGERILGSFPGGPRRRGPSEEPVPSVRLHRVEEIEAGIARRRLVLNRKRRRRRTVGGMVFALSLAGAAGLLVGLLSTSSAEELTAAQMESQSRERGASQDLNRALLELWKMEDLEYMRNSNRL